MQYGTTQARLPLRPSPVLSSLPIGYQRGSAQPARHKAIEPFHKAVSGYYFTLPSVIFKLSHPRPLLQLGSTVPSCQMKELPPSIFFSLLLCPFWFSQTTPAAILSSVRIGTTVRYVQTDTCTCSGFRMTRRLVPIAIHVSHCCYHAIASDIPLLIPVLARITSSCL